MKPSRVGASWLVGRVSIDASEPLDVLYVLLTHHHPAHTAGLSKSAPRAVIANPFEAGMLIDGNRFRSYVRAVFKRAGAPDREVQQPKAAGRFARIAAGWVDLEEFSAQVLPCGSHSWGHTCFKLEEGIFVGDLGGWVANVDALRRSIALLRSLGNTPVYPSHDPVTTAAEYAEALEGKLRGLLRAYGECLREGVPYAMALCVHGGGDTLRLAEEGIAFAKYLAEVGLARLIIDGGRYRVKKLG
ncbi:MAG: MBL fold metallo-hydrolase [Thermoproteus sp.]